MCQADEAALSRSSVVCAAIVGRLGTASLGAVGLSTLLFVFSNLFFNFLTVVTTSNVAGAFAVNDEQEVRLWAIPTALLPRLIHAFDPMTASIRLFKCALLCRCPGRR